MNILTVLNLILGVIFIYFLMGLICNSIFEAISTAIGLRSKYLTQWITQSFPEIYSHLTDSTVVNGLSAKGQATSYMSSSNFATAIISIISIYWKKVPASVQDINQALDDFNSPSNTDRNQRNLFPQDFQTLLRIYAAQAQSSSKDSTEQMKTFVGFIENWFDSMMERLTGVYKRRSMLSNLIVAAIITVALNVDSISIVRYLISDPSAIVALENAAMQAESDSTWKIKSALIAQNDTSITVTTKVNDSLSTQTTIKTIKSKMDDGNKYKDQLAGYIPVGWGTNLQNESKLYQKQVYFWLAKFFGLLLTTMAVSLGAPFWYDLLCKAANLRGSLKPQTAMDKANKAISG